MLKTAVIGASGYIGGHLWRSYRRAFPDCVGTRFSSAALDLQRFDICDPKVAPLRLEETGHQAVLLASARSSIAYCQREPSAAYAVNVKGTLDLVRELGRTSLQVIFLSSDYVFEGSSGAYDDDAPTGPTTEYGRQKELVEKEIPSLVENYLILRLSKVYGLQKKDGTLLDEMACSLASGREVPAAGDLFFSPTCVEDVVRAIQAIQDCGLKGVINVCSAERRPYYDLALAIAETMSVHPRRVKKISLHDLPSMAGRPLNPTMVCSRLWNKVRVPFMPLQGAVQQVAENWRGA